MVNPSAFAVLRLMISSNFVGCSTGISAGFGALEDPIDVSRQVAEVAHLSRFRPLALFERLPSARVDRVVVQASENLHRS